MAHKSFYIFLIFTFLSTANLHSREDLLIAESCLCKFEELKKISADCSDAVVKLVKNEDDLYFILKQIVILDLDEQFLLIRDLVASEIGVICGIPINKVFIYPAVATDDIRFYHDRAATIHSFVQGISLDEEFPEILFKNFTLQQKFINPNSPWQKNNPLKENQQGLTQKIIESMALHSDLPKIVAFDTFVGNADRSYPNIFYDKSTDKFYGIDNAAAFNCRNLPLLAIERIKELQAGNFFNNCDTTIMRGLKLYHETLIKLYENIEPKFVQESLQKYSQYLCKKDDKESLKFVMQRAKFHGKAFEKNYKFVKELICLLEEIIY